MSETETTVLTLIGEDREGLPIWLVKGGAPDDDDEDDGIEVGGEDEEDDGSEEEGEDGDGDEDETPPKPKAPAKKVAPQKAPAKKLIPKAPANATKEQRLARSVKIERDRALTAEKQLKALRAKNETEAETRAREANETAEARYKPVAVKAAARSALVEAKIKGDPGRAVRLMDLAAIDIDEDGEAIGIEDQIEIIKADFPEMFESDDDEQEKAPPRKKAPAKVNAGNRPPVKDSGKKQTSAEKIAAMFEE